MITSDSSVAKRMEAAMPLPRLAAVLPLTILCCLSAALSEPEPQMSCHGIDVAKHGGACPCSESLTDTDSFYCEDSTTWRLRKSFALKQFASNLKFKTFTDLGRGFFQENWEPELHCAIKERIGRMGDGKRALTWRK